MRGICVLSLEVKLSFKEEAIELAKQITAEWEDNKDFNVVVTILEDYITDMDSKYQGLIENAKVSS